MQRLDHVPGPVADPEGLIGRIAAGERDALADLYRQFQRPLFRYLTQILSDRGLAEEVLQDTLVAVWRNAGTFEGRSQVSTWLFGIARRQAHNALRRRRQEASTEDLGEMPSDGPGTEHRALVNVELAETSSAIARLSTLHREVLGLAFVAGLSYEEMARVLDVPEGTVKSRLSNARRALATILGGGGR